MGQINTTDICNMALGYLGANPVLEINDETPEGTLCEQHFDQCRDAVLEEISWTFATRRFILGAPLREKPAFGYAYAFQLPDDILRVVSVGSDHGPNNDWTLEGRNILVNTTRIFIVAIYRQTDESVYSPEFVQALAARLASEIALPLTNSPGIFQTMVQMYSGKIRMAQSSDGRQGIPLRRYSTSHWRR